MYGTNSPAPISQAIATRPVKLKGSDPVAYVMVDDRTVDPTVHEELSLAEQDVARTILEAAAKALEAAAKV